MEDEEFLERVERSGMTVPELDARPNLLDWESEIWAAFSVLNSQRAGGLVGAEPLNVPGVDVWLRAHGFSGELHMEALDLILLLDSKWRALPREAKNGSGS